MGEGGQDAEADLDPGPEADTVLGEPDPQREADPVRASKELAEADPRRTPRAAPRRPDWGWPTAPGCRHRRVRRCLVRPG